MKNMLQHWNAQLLVKRIAYAPATRHYFFQYER